MTGGLPRPSPDAAGGGGTGATADAWTLVIDGWNPADEGRREALCTLGNGRFATRGAAPESAADGVHYPGTYAAGCYDRLRDQVAGRAVENESLVNLPNWLDLRFAVDDGDWVDLSATRVLEHRLSLDLRRGVLGRRLRFVDGAGRTTSVRQRRFVHMAQPHLAGLHTVVTAEDWAGRFRVAAGIDGTVTTPVCGATTACRGATWRSSTPASPTRGRCSSSRAPCSPVCASPRPPGRRCGGTGRCSTRRGVWWVRRAGSPTSWSWSCARASRCRSRRSSRW
ncbi:hypothetical protein GCM10010210_52230 [Pseudonocardia hydrocarbonoxydans]